MSSDNFNQKVNFMELYEEDMFAFFVSQELNNARKEGNFGFEIYHLITVGSVSYKPNPTIIISPGNDLRKIVATYSAKTREVRVDYSQSYHDNAKEIVHKMNGRAKKSISEINPNPPYHFKLSGRIPL